MYGVFCQRFGLGRTLFSVLNAYESTGRLCPFSGRTISSGAKVGRPRKEHKPTDIEACQAYLVQSWGLCPKIAEKLSRKRGVSMGWGSFKLAKADAALKNLRDHGFDDTQMAKLVRSRSEIIFTDVEKVIVPKLQFFGSMGIPKEDLRHIVTTNPAILFMSLKKSLVPKLEFLRTILVDNDDIIKAINNNSNIFLVNCDRILAPNLATLREVGVPQHLVRRMMTNCPRNVVTRSRDMFMKGLVEVTKMGFHPKKSQFIHAMNVFSAIPEAARDRKMDILRKYGMNESEIQNTVKKQPEFMLQSDEKLMSKMEFLIKDMSWTPSDIAVNPYVLNHSLENKLMPWCSVLRLLQSEGLLGKDLMLLTFLKLGDKAFHDKFVADYLDKIPQLLDVFRRRMSPSVLLGTSQRSGANL